LTPTHAPAQIKRPDRVRKHPAGTCHSAQRHPRAMTDSPDIMSLRGSCQGVCGYSQTNGS